MTCVKQALSRHTFTEHLTLPQLAGLTYDDLSEAGWPCAVTFYVTLRCCFFKYNQQTTLCFAQVQFQELLWP